MAYTTIDDPSAYFQTMLWTGDTVDDRNMTFDGNSDLQFDWIWEKSRSGTTSHNTFDSTRGIDKILYMDTGDSEDTTTDEIKAINSDGFTMGTSNNWNADTVTYVAWGWKANGGTRTTFSESGDNPAGGYQANTTAGFSIVDYTGTGGAGTIAHGLGAVPDFIVTRSKTENQPWRVYHSSNTSAPETDGLDTATNAATADSAAYWNDTAPTSTVFTVGDDASTNQDTKTYICFIFKSIQGYSKFGAYTGNGNVVGPFIYTGFKPSFVTVKKTSAVHSWYMQFVSRGFNPVRYSMIGDTEAAQSDESSMDFCSNGFKLRTTGNAHNTDAATFIYMAFAEQPFVTSGGVPCTAR